MSASVDPAAEAKRPIVVASNRLPFTLSRTAKGLERRSSTGGLVAALEPVLRKRGGTWVGWPGTELREGETISRNRQAYRTAPVLLSETEVNRFYHSFSNRTLWPLLHSMTERARFDVSRLGDLRANQRALRQRGGGGRR